MPDQITPELGAPVVPVAPVVTAPTDAPTVLPEDHPLVKTLALLKAEVKSLKPQATAYEELVESQKTEAQRQADAALAVATERDAARAEALAYRVAAAHGVTPDNFDLLGTGTEEAITARAERVGGLLKVQAENEQLRAELEALRAGKPSPATTRPVADLKPGATPQNAVTEDDALYNSLFGAPTS
jgi:hypothetical protein